MRIHELIFFSELTDTMPFTTTDFQLYVAQAIKRVLGTCGPQVQVDDFDETSRKGSVIVTGEDAQLVWASLTISGQYQNRTIATHLFSVSSVFSPKNYRLKHLIRIFPSSFIPGACVAVVGGAL
uniref:Ribonuclease P n=1 Tax=Angiostrongylus cantonensis TaxID=6313 RepID=A0A0K0CTM1_ANGCA